MSIEELKKNALKNGIEVIFVQTGQEALEKAKEYIKPGLSIGLGGSVSVEEIGLLEYLTSRKDITLYNQYEDGISKEENTKRRKNGITADIYITGTNAITKEGWLINYDGSGNRVAAQIFGSDKLLIIAGVNKIVSDIHEGLDRIEKIAAVKNAQRLNKKALTFGKSADATAQSISNKGGIIHKDVPGRISVILVNETLGY
ncbi:MAG: lactate utilization protein [Campylobacteraceae bacterium]|jgi:L-lactate utilization protein LutB|nr:lactate utilization protein [Campylobacteraceae bacterium]